MKFQILCLLGLLALPAYSADLATSTNEELLSELRLRLDNPSRPNTSVKATYLCNEIGWLVAEFADATPNQEGRVLKTRIKTTAVSTPSAAACSQAAQILNQNRNLINKTTEIVLCHNGYAHRTQIIPVPFSYSDDSPVELKKLSSLKVSLGKCWESANVINNQRSK